MNIRKIDPKAVAIEFMERLGVELYESNACVRVDSKDGTIYLEGNTQRKEICIAVVGEKDVPAIKFIDQYTMPKDFPQEIGEELIIEFKTKQLRETGKDDFTINFSTNETDGILTVSREYPLFGGGRAQKTLSVSDMYGQFMIELSYALMGQILAADLLLKRMQWALDLCKKDYSGIINL